MAYTKYSLTPANNTATPPDGAPEGMLPSAVNDTMRDMMAQIRDVGDGIRGGTYTMTAPVITGGTITGVAFTGNTFTNPVITGGSINNTTIGGTTAAAGTFTSLSDSGNLTFTGTGNRITGDFSNATLANRVLFQTSTTNGNSVVGVLPNGTATTSVFRAFNNSDPTNAAEISLFASSSTNSLISGITGTGTYLPLTMLTGGSERLRIDTSGNVGIGTSSPGARLDVNPSSGTIFRCFTSGVAQLLIGNGGASTNYYDGDTQIFRSGNATERMRITSGGDVLIGTTTANSQTGITLRPDGVIVAKGVYNTLVSSSTRDIYMDDSGYFGYISSTRNSKTNINNLSDVSWLYALTPVSFNYKKLNRETNQYENEADSENQYGLIAEDVEPINAELCFYDDTENGKELRGVSYTKLITPMLKAIQEQQQIINDLKARIETLESK